MSDSIETVLSSEINDIVISVYNANDVFCIKLL